MEHCPNCKSKLEKVFVYIEFVKGEDSIWLDIKNEQVILGHVVNIGRFEIEGYERNDCSVVCPHCLERIDMAMYDNGVRVLGL